MRMICSKQFFAGSFFYSIHFFLIHFSKWYGGTFARSYFGDFLGLIVLVPLFVFFQTSLGIQRKEFIPFHEILFYWVLISVVFEVVVPYFLKRGSADIIDVICYLLGGLVLYVSQFFKEVPNKQSF